MKQKQRREINASLGDRFNLSWLDFYGKLHEIAHFVTVFRRKPRSKWDFVLMQRRLDAMPCGRAQVHETRTCAVELEAYRRLGIHYGSRRLVKSVWPGIQESDVNSSGKGKMVVKSKRDTLRRVLAHNPSERVVQAMVTTVKDCLR